MHSVQDGGSAEIQTVTLSATNKPTNARQAFKLSLPTSEWFIATAGETTCLDWGATAGEVEAALNKLTLDIRQQHSTNLMAPKPTLGTGIGGGVRVTRTGTGDS